MNKGVHIQNHINNKYYTCINLYLLKIMGFFNLTLKLTMKVTSNYKHNTINGFSSRNPMKIKHYSHVPSFIWGKLYFRLLDLEIYLLTLKMTLNHEINTRNGYFSQNYTKKGIPLVPTFC